MRSGEQSAVTPSRHLSIRAFQNISNDMLNNYSLTYQKQEPNLIELHKKLWQDAT